VDAATRKKGTRRALSGGLGGKWLMLHLLWLCLFCALPRNCLLLWRQVICAQGTGISALAAPSVRRREPVREKHTRGHRGHRRFARMACWPTTTQTQTQTHTYSYAHNICIRSFSFLRLTGMAVGLGTWAWLAGRPPHSIPSHDPT